jgi:hypothetical protein
MHAVIPLSIKWMELHPSFWYLSGSFPHSSGWFLCSSRSTSDAPPELSASEVLQTSLGPYWTLSEIKGTILRWGAQCMSWGQSPSELVILTPLRDCMHPCAWFLATILYFIIYESFTMKPIWNPYETYMKLIQQYFTLLYMRNSPWNLYETYMKLIQQYFTSLYMKLLQQYFTLLYVNHSPWNLYETYTTILYFIIYDKAFCSKARVQFEQGTLLQWGCML